MEMPRCIIFRQIESLMIRLAMRNICRAVFEYFPSVWAMLFLEEILDRFIGSTVVIFERTYRFKRSKVMDLLPVV